MGLFAVVDPLSMLVIQFLVTFFVTVVAGG